MHNHQSALDSQIEENEINWLFPAPDNDDILENLYEEVLEENPNLEHDEAVKLAQEKFDELPEPSDYEMMASFGTKWHDWL